MNLSTEQLPTRLINEGWVEVSSDKATHAMVANEGFDHATYWNGYCNDTRNPMKISKLGEYLSKYYRIGYKTESFGLNVFFLKKQDSKRAKLERRAEKMREELNKLDEEIK